MNANMGAAAGAPAYALEGKRVWVAGHRGMVGAALVRRLGREGCEVLTAARADADLTRQADVERWMERERPDTVIVAAARVGGILANDTFPADFLYDNLMIEANIIHAAHRVGVGKLLFLGSSCIYPKLAPQPITEDALLTGPLEPTNEWYAIAKIAGIKLCQAYRRQHGRDFISGMPTNLYGPGDNFDLASSHVIPALMRKAHEAKQRGDHEMVIWGTGTPRREFLHVDDCADALVYLLKVYSGDEHVNVGSGTDVTIRELAETVARTVGFEGRIVTDTTKPDGTPRKLMSGDKLAALGWTPRITLADGLASTYVWFKARSGAAEGSVAPVEPPAQPAPPKTAQEPLEDGPKPMRFKPYIRYVPVELPPPVGNAPSVLAFSLAKAGSTLLYDILSMLAPHAGLTYFSISDNLFHRNINANDSPSNIGSAFQPDGYCFGGFRVFPIYPVPILHSAKAIFLVRDPRDMIVSLYFSLMKSHTIPGNADPGSESERMLRAREFAQKTPLKQYAALAVRTQLRMFEGYLAQGVHWRPNFVVYRYEDVIFKKREWIQDICDWYGWNPPIEIIDQILSQVDLFPDEERPDQHVRQVAPGNYLKHLDEATIKSIDTALAQCMKVFGYS